MTVVLPHSDAFLLNSSKMTFIPTLAPSWQAKNVCGLAALAERWPLGMGRQSKRPRLSALPLPSPAPFLPAEP